MAVFFSGSFIPRERLSAVLALIGRRPNNVFNSELAQLRTCEFYLKPIGNNFTTTKGYKIYLASGFFTWSSEFQAEILVHEAIHSISQTRTGVTWWLAKYLASPSFCLDAELAAIRNQAAWKVTGFVRWTNEQWAIWANQEALDLLDSYFLLRWTYSREYVVGRIQHLINLERAKVAV